MFNKQEIKNLKRELDINFYMTKLLTHLRNHKDLLSVLTDLRIKNEVLSTDNKNKIKSDINKLESEIIRIFATFCIQDIAYSEDRREQVKLLTILNPKLNFIELFQMSYECNLQSESYKLEDINKLIIVLTKNESELKLNFSIESEDTRKLIKNLNDIKDQLLQIKEASKLVNSPSLDQFSPKRGAPSSFAGSKTSFLKENEAKIKKSSAKARHPRQNPSPEIEAKYPGLHTKSRPKPK